MQRVYRVAETGEPHPLAIRDAAGALCAGALALMPTETVYGIGVAVNAYAAADVLPEQDSGYRRIFSLKQRELTQTVPWLVADETALDEFGCNIPDEVYRIARACWPGPLTIVVQASDRVPSFMRASDGTVALRASASPVVQALIRACESPLAVTSANTHGAPAPASFDAAERRIVEGVDVAIDAGKTACRDASTIISFTQGNLEILRKGALASAYLEEILANPTAFSQKGC